MKIKKTLGHTSYLICVVSIRPTPDSTYMRAYQLSPILKIIKKNYLSNNQINFQLIKKNKKLTEISYKYNLVSQILNFLI